MAREDYSIISAFTSAGAFVVTTRDSALISIVASGSANATAIHIFAGVNTAGTKKYILGVPAALTTEGGPYSPIICSGGITATNIGTVTTYAVLFTDV